MDFSRPGIQISRLYNFDNVREYSEWPTFGDDIFNLTEFVVEWSNWKYVSLG